MTDTSRIAEILRCAGILLPNDYTRSWDYNRALNELAAEVRGPYRDCRNAGRPRCHRSRSESA